MAATYEPIASTTVGSGGAANVEFTGISGVFTDLAIVFHGFGETGTHNLDMRFNSDTGSNYSFTRLFGNGSSAGSNRQSSQTAMRTSYDATLVSSAYTTQILHIMSYANTNVYKTALSSAARAGSGVDRVVGLWRSTSAITSVTLFHASTDIGEGSVISLYGIKAA